MLDFYGTLVHEDDEIIPGICERIRQHCDAGTAACAREIARYWWEAFVSICSHAHGARFISQREAALESLGSTIRRYGARLDPAELIAPQFANWAAPALFPETLQVLEALARAEVPVCIVSNIDRCDLEQAIGLHGIKVASVVTSDDIRAYKPRPEMFDAALAALGLAPGEVLHVGDSRSSDIAGAKGAGIDVAWINRTGKIPVDAETPTYTVRDLSGILAILLGGHSDGVNRGSWA